MQIKACNPNFFIVRIDKTVQKDKKESNGILKRASTFTFGRAGMQSGEIICIGKFAKILIPKAKIGGTLIFSWKVEYCGEDGQVNMALVNEDEQYKYYSVTIAAYKGRQPETFAYFDDEVFMTHPHYIILKKDKEIANQLVKKNSIYVYNNWRMSEDEINHKIEFNKNWIYSLGITHRSKLQKRESDARQVAEQMKMIEKENRELTKLLQGKEEFERYTVVYSNPLQEIENGQEVFAWNVFCLEKIFINNNEYIITAYKHVGAVEKSELVAV